LTGLRQSEAQAQQMAAVAYRNLFEQGNHFAAILAPEGGVLEANRQLLETCGFARDSVTGKPFWECGWWNRSTELMETIRWACKQAASGTVFRSVLSYFTADGGERTVDLVIAPVLDEHGKVLFLNPTGTDITERMRAEVALRESEGRHRFLSQLLAATQSLIDPDEIMAVSARLLAEHLGADRCAYAEVENEATFVITGDYSPALPSIVGRWPVVDFGDACLRLMSINEPYVVHDVDADARIASHHLPAYRATQIGAVICVPLHKEGKFTAAMAVQQSKARQWHPSEVKLVTDVVARCWETLERARTALAERRLHAAVAAERARLEELFQLAPAFMAVLSGPDHVVERVNAKCTKVLGNRDLIGRPLREVLPELQGQRLLEILDDVYRSGQPHSATNASVKLRSVEDRLLREHTLEYVYQPIRDTEGNTSGVLIQGIDLTQRTRAEANLSNVVAESDRRRRLYETALSNTPDLVYVFDLQHRFTYANEALLRMWGRTWSEAIGKTCLELGYEPWHAAMHDREIDQVRSTKQPIRGEVPFTGTNGCRFYDYIFVPVLGANGEVEAVTGTTRDVTERKAMEQELREADKKKDEFLAMLAHELRNPLAPVRSGLDLLRLTGHDAEVLDVMQSQVEHLVRLVDDLLDVSRIMRGKVELRMEIVDVSAIVKRAVETVQPMIEKLHQNLHVCLPSQPVWLDADPIRLTQAIGNLLNNASKYSETGGQIDLTVAVEDSWVAINVRDNGIGISSELLPQVFDLFTQDHRHVDRSQGGLGIGLTVVKSLTEMHGGKAEGRSEGPGHGSEFTLRLPVSCHVSTVRDACVTTTPSPGLRILVVDDNVSATVILCRLLSKLGNHHVFTVHDGAEAVTAIKSQFPDLVLLDIGLPNLDGYEVAREIRQRPELAHVRIIALTGYGSQEDRRKSSQAGFDGHLVKPLGIDVLRSVLAGAVPQ
jgi:PAS domain S-box-containing protein